MRKATIGLWLLTAFSTAACGSYKFYSPSPPASVAAMDTVAAQSSESYAKIVENGFVSVAQQPVSTFAADVDTASYSNVRRFLTNGSLPPRDAVRIEELINYFSYDYPEPSGDAPFSVTTELAPAPWNPSHRLLHIGLQGKRLERGELPPHNLVFLLDVSGSMNEPNKLPLLKRSLKELVETLDQDDRVAIVVYAGASGLVLPSTPATQRTKILEALDRLEAGGSTNGGAGIELAYRTARAALRPGGVNRVLLATDGDFNVGITDHDDLVRLIERERDAGVFLTVLGYGMGNYKDSTLEALANKGNGNYAYIDDIAEARKVLVREAGGTLVTIAKDVKIQVELDPASVQKYRLIGYENRLLRREDFDDDRKDAGEIGAGHSVTALYEIVPASGVSTDSALGALRLRYKLPAEDQSRLIEHGLPGAVAEQPSDNFRFSAAVAGFGMLLFGSEHKGNASFQSVSELARGALGQDPHGYRRELVSLIERAHQLSPRAAVVR